MTHKLILLSCSLVALTYLAAMVYGGWAIGASLQAIQRRTVDQPTPKPGKKFANGA